jgi:hypothetical protein
MSNHFWFEVVAGFQHMTREREEWNVTISTLTSFWKHPDGTFSPISLLASWIFESISFQFILYVACMG